VRSPSLLLLTNKTLQFAIRPSIRNHTILKRDWVIQQTAGLVDQELHKVNLTTPEKVILIDIFQASCYLAQCEGANQWLT